MTSPRGGIVREARRPPGWMAPGPRPAGPGARTDLWPGPGEDLCFLVGDWRIFQRLDGHRWSMDDLVTAWFAATHAAAPPRRFLDLGCGIGSVLLSLAWRFPAAAGVGIEAQALSVALCRRSIAYDGAEGRVTLREGDFRDPGLVSESEAGGFELVTGTPPYFTPGAGVESPAPQKGPCRFEHRGGVEDYLAVAARALAPTGRFAMCAAFGQSARIDAAAADHGFGLVARTHVVPRVGKAPLLGLHAFGRGEAAPVQPSTLVVRDDRGEWTAAFRAVRRDMGLPDRAR
jgi:tRNA1(Val) A37 N6-methylase TrmN6